MKEIISTTGQALNKRSFQFVALVIAVLFLGQQNGLTQKITITQEWTSSIGGQLSDELVAVKEIPGEGYLLAGFSSSPVSGDKTAPYWEEVIPESGFPGDYWVVKLDQFGSKVWDVSFGGSEGEWPGNQGDRDVLHVASDGSYLLGGVSLSPVSGNKSAEQFGQYTYDFWLVKFDKNGALVWDKSFGGIGGDLLNTMEMIDDGCFLLGGSSGSPISGNKSAPEIGSSDFWLVKIDANGGVVWDRSYGGKGSEEISSIAPAGDGGFLLAGNSFSGIAGTKSSESFGGSDYWVVRVDSNGDRLWDASFGGRFWDSITSVEKINDGFLLIGRSESGVSGNKSMPFIDSHEEQWVVKIDHNGTKLAEFSLPYDQRWKELPVSDGGFVKYAQGAWAGDFKIEKFAELVLAARRHVGWQDFENIQLQTTTSVGGLWESATEAFVELGEKRIIPVSNDPKRFYRLFVPSDAPTDDEYRMITGSHLLWPGKDSGLMLQYSEDREGPWDTYGPFADDGESFLAPVPAELNNYYFRTWKTQ